jgi:hypothetical protein
MRSKVIGATTAFLTLISLCALSAALAQGNASAAELQPSPRPPLFGTQTAEAALTQTAAAGATQPGGGGGGGPTSTSAPPTSIPPTRVLITRTPTEAPPTWTPIVIVITATPGPATETPTLAPPLLTSTFTAAPPSPTTAPATSYPAAPTAYPAPAQNPPSGAGAGEISPLLWIVIVIPFLALAIALWWLFLRRLPLFPPFGRPRRGSQRAGRRYVRRRSFPF